MLTLIHLLFISIGFIACCSAMLYARQSLPNVTAELQYQGLLERVMLSTLSTLPSCAFLFINGTMLRLLRSKPVFRENSRYILLYNLLFADTLNLTQSQILFLLAAGRVKLTYSVCGLLTQLANLTVVISPLTLVLMSVERLVAVCYPLRHATIITIGNTKGGIMLVWTFSSLNVLTRVILLVQFPFQDVQMKDFCGTESILINIVSGLYEKAFTYVVFLSAGVSVTFSYIAVTVAARSASTDTASVRKARNTLLLHVVQLGLSLSSTIHNPLLTAVSKLLDRITIVRLQFVLYVSIIILPRCLSSLIYGIRDQSIRPVLMYSLCCQWRHRPSLSGIAATAKTNPSIT